MFPWRRHSRCQAAVATLSVWRHFRLVSLAQAGVKFFGSYSEERVNCRSKNGRKSFRCHGAVPVDILSETFSAFSQTYSLHRSG